MTDKPDVADATKAADAEVAALGAAIAGEEMPVIVEGKDSVSDLDEKAPGEKEASPDGGGPADSQEKTKPGDGGDEKPKDGKGKGSEEEDPLKDLAGDPDGALKVLLEHPELGPVLNRWMDRAAQAQVTSALTKATPTIEANAKQLEAERVEDEHFSEMTQEQITEEITGDEKAASAYARYQQRKEAGALPNAEAIAQSSQVYSYATRVATVSSMLEGSELTDEVKESLKPEHFTHLGAEGIREWEKAVLKEIVNHEAAGLAEKLKEEEWETYKEEHMAELDPSRPAVISGGRKNNNLPDLMGTDSTVQLEQGLAAEESKRNK